MAQTVGTHGVAVFTSPSNGDTLDATVVKGNDNNLRSAYVDHDADGGLHVQSSSLATRSSPGSLGRKWLTTDASSYRLFFDDGSAWYELSYLSTNGGTVTGNMTVTGTLTASVTGPVTGNASTATALQTARNINGVAFNGTADITVTAAAGTLSGSTLNSGVTASSLTSVGTLGTLTVSGNATFDTDTLVVDSANNRVGVGIASPAYSLQVRRAGGAGSLGISIDTVGATDRTVQYFAVQDSAVGAGSGHAWYYRPSGSTTDTLGFTLDELGNLVVDTNTLFVDAANNRVGVGTVTPLTRMHINDGTNRNILVSTDATQFGTSGMAVGSFTDGAAGYAPLVLIGSTVQVAAGGSIRATFDTSGNLGLGVTPSAWASAARAVQFGSVGAMYQDGSGGVELAQNAYESAVNTYRYLISFNASRYEQQSGQHKWFTAPSGTAGNVISFTQAMTLNANGSLVVGSATANRAGANTGISVEGASTSILESNVNASRAGFLYADLASTIVGEFRNLPLLFRTNDTERARIDASGNLGLGVTPSAWGSGTRAIQVGSSSVFYNPGSINQTWLYNNAYNNGTNELYLNTAAASSFRMVGGAYQWLNAPSGTSGAAISFTQRMTLDASGNLLVGDSSNGYGAANRGLVEINGTSDSLLGFKVASNPKGYVGHSGTDLSIANQVAGNIYFTTNNVSRWAMNSTGHFIANIDATYDIGASGANRPRDYYGSGNSILGGFVRVAAASAGVASTTTIGSTTATTVGATGAAAALPANPLGYIIAHVGTTQVKIPYYTA